MSIRAEHLNHIYGEGTAFEQYALKDVSFEIEDGQFIGLIGHTGSGKSTLIQHLNGLLRASSGAIYYNGENIYQDGYDMKALRSKVGLVAHDKASKRLQNFFICLLIDPVIAVYHFKIDTGRCPKTGIDCLTVTSVFLVDGLADTRITCLVLVCDLSRIVLRGAVIHDQDFYLVSARKQRLDTVSHIAFRIVTWNCYR